MSDEDYIDNELESQRVRHCEDCGAQIGRDGRVTRCKKCQKKRKSDMGKEYRELRKKDKA